MINKMVYEKEERRDYDNCVDSVGWEELQRELEAETTKLLERVDKELKRMAPPIEECRHGNGFNINNAVDALMYKALREALYNI